MKFEKERKKIQKGNNENSKKKENLKWKDRKFEKERKKIWKGKKENSKSIDRKFKKER